MSQVPQLELNDGVRIPQLGFGVWQVPDEQAVPSVAEALRTGYRSIDTATLYQNEEGVGKAIAESGIPREELFVTTKLANPDQGYEETLRAFEESVRRLGLEYVDLYLIHWPLPKVDKYVDTWKAFEKLKADGRIRSIGVSNFQVPHLERLFAETEVVPSVNQIELHPNLPQRELREFHAKHGIATEAWSPLASGELLQDSTLGALAEKYGKSTAQIILRWHIQLGNIVIPKSVTPERIRSNFDVFDFELGEDDVATIDGLENGRRTGPHPDEMNHT
ncbi:aldo/keto reductase [Sciscionella sediminilitoris]|uniref:aldo/keto reductase n=1 Tax=Sciscionella sediminilitoris TaxID=1445613 RepID=UPI0004DEDA34|nr:aldo/keto reductase [Sciscionella sp. SE31]